MRKRWIWFLVSVCLLGLSGCGTQPVKPVNTIEGNMGTYYELSDGTWQFEDLTYQYRLEITGRMPNAVQDTTYVYLSNIENIPFQKAMLASGISSNSKDYFPVEEAVLVELI